MPLFYRSESLKMENEDEKNALEYDFESCDSYCKRSCRNIWRTSDNGLANM